MVSRLFTALLILVYLTYTRFDAELRAEVIRTALVLFVVLAIMSLVRGLRIVLEGIRLFLLFTLAGALVFYLSYILGWLAPDPVNIPVGALRLVAFFLSFSLFFQVLSLEEWRYVFSKIGLKTQSHLLSVTAAHIPVLLNYLSESAVAIKLKFKGKKLYKLVVPLILLSLYTARGLYEAHLIYGATLRPRVKFTIFKKKDVLLYCIVLLLIIAGFLIK
ncbi:MAG: hypothetical protein QXM43_06155 [Desulfurococcaceae archaeon]|uniref:hypothetical protein n=1 Tax=Desulfurococcus sp. TaxID=51678 RepID=UPI00316F81B3